jgi:peptidoglycan/LPS O-acetylase OafA/YrhL
VRGVAAVWVVLYHAAKSFPRIIPHSTFTSEGFRAVDLFFILSGFILMHAHNSDFVAIQTQRTGDFYLARILRVYPVHLVVLLCILAATWIVPDFVPWYNAGLSSVHVVEFSRAGFVRNFFLANVIARNHGDWNGPTWSLSAEMAGYLLFPVLAFALGKIRSAIVSALVCVGSLACLVLYEAGLHRYHDNIIGQHGLFRMLCGFVAGVALSRVCRLYQPTDRVARTAGLLSVIPIVLCVAVYQIDPFMVFGFAGLIWALYYQQGIVNVIFGSKLVVFLGAISFPLYLCHFFILAMARYLAARSESASTIGTQSIFLAAALVASFAIAYLLHVFVENPSHRAGRALLKKRKQSRPIKVQDKSELAA